jgi:hypothetical protein
VCKTLLRCLERVTRFWMDHLMMTPEYQLVQGNFGSKTLLERV